MCPFLTGKGRQHAALAHSNLASHNFKGVPASLDPLQSLSPQESGQELDKPTKARPLFTYLLKPLAYLHSLVTFSIYIWRTRMVGLLYRVAEKGIMMSKRHLLLLLKFSMAAILSAWACVWILKPTQLWKRSWHVAEDWTRPTFLGVIGIFFDKQTKLKRRLIRI